MAHMATADGALRRLFEKPLPENPSLLEVLAACSNHIHHKKPLLPPVDPSSFTEIFGELHFHEKPEARFVLPPPPPPHPAAAAVPARGATTVSWLDAADRQAAEKSKDDSSLDALLRPPKPASFSLKKSASFCLKKSSASLLLCTEGLGSESTVDSDDMVKGDGGDAALSPGKEKATFADAGQGLLKEMEPPSFPPPIRSIGRGGKPCVCFRTSREDGRFVLTQVVIPGKELLHASREGGRLRLTFANAAAATGDEYDEELELGDDEDRELESNTTCIGACA
uniref:Uncharacterized protein n=1 Tax=Avena sativa TaxID=4498 RepID=A0ACD6A3U0_AVESA